MIFLFLFSCAIVGKFFQTNDKLKNLQSANIGFGLAANMYFYIWVKYLSLNWLFSLIPILFCMAHHFVINKKGLKPQMPTKVHFLEWAIVLIVFLPNLIQSVYMGVGDYPKVFFNVDNPFHLQFVHQLNSTDQYPPQADYLDRDPTNYHFGIHSISSMLSKFTSFDAHIIFLLVMPLILNFLLYTSIIEFFRKKNSSTIIPIISLTLKFSYNQSYADYLHIFSLIGLNLLMIKMSIILICMIIPMIYSYLY